MKELVVEILKIIAPVSVGLIVFAQGLGIAPNTVVAYARERPGVMLRSLVAALLLVPAAALALVLVLKPTPGVAIGLAILVACPPAPLMLKAAPKMGGASAAFMASLHLSLAALAFLTVPATLYLLSIPLGFHAAVDVSAMAWILARTILIPISLGMAFRAFFPKFADRAGPVLAKAGTLGLVVVVLFAAVAVYPALLKMDPWSYLVIAVVSAAALAIGHFLGPVDPSEKITLAVECGVRHPVLALTIAAANFSPQRALPVLVPCVLTFIVVAMIYLVWRGRRLAAGKPAGTDAIP
jgi:bile acid:Na+ symporter, BASS family